MSPAGARADWPSYRLVVSGGTDWPIGGAIRAWGPADEIFVLTDETADSLSFETEDQAELKWYRCSNGDGCATDTLMSTEAIGDPVYWENSLQPSMAIRRSNSSSPIELLLTLRQDLQEDCDGDEEFAYETEVSPEDPDDQENLDLYTQRWDTSSGFVDGWAIEINDTAEGCVNHGVSRTQWRGGTNGFACYTRSPSPGKDRLACDDDGSATWQWLNQFQMYNGGEHEDHPSFAFYLSSNDVAVAGTQRPSTSDRVRVHFPDAIAPPSEPVVSWDATGGDFADHTSLVDAGGKLHLVWADNTGSSAQIRYQECDWSSTVDCTDSGDWLTTPTAVVNSTSGYNHTAQFPELIIDGDNQFVVYQYDAGSGSNQWRVMVASRCAGDTTWSVEQVRTPGSSIEDQFLAIGRPSVAINKDEQILHVLLTEATSGYLGGYQFGGVTDSDLYWYRKEYTLCE